MVTAISVLLDLRERVIPLDAWLHLSLTRLNQYDQQPDR
jgi:hypothetical protein